MKKTTMLKKNYEFKTVLTKGKFLKGNIIEICVLNNCLNKNFLGIAVSTKCGKAVKRNNAKRLIRESYYRLEEKISSGKSIVILINKKYDITNIEFSEVFEEMEKIFKACKVLV